MPLRRHPPKGNVRNVHSNGKTTTGVIVNNQNEIVQFESGKEEILPLLFLRDRTIKRLVSQPLEISYYDLEGKLHTYTPDFLVERIDGSIEIHEFSMSRRRMTPEAIARERAAKQYCDERGWKYIVHTEHDIPGPTARDNLQALYGFSARVYSNEAVRKTVKSLLVPGERVTYSYLINDLVTMLSLEKRIVSATIFHQLWFEELCTDLNQLIFVMGIPNPKMQIWLP